MDYTFEITIAGCATNCAHCYVDGGPAPIMPLDEYYRAVDALEPVFEKLGGTVNMTLGNELFCHPQIAEILRHNAKEVPKQFSYRHYPVPTTGIALVRRADRDEILDALCGVGASKFMLALHGAKEDHDRIVQNPNGYDGIFETADWLTANGFGLFFNLMVSKPFLNGISEIAESISKYPNMTSGFKIPLYVPTARMRRYQSIRAEREDCVGLAAQALSYGMNVERLLSGIGNSESEIRRDLMEHGFDYAAEKRSMPDWMFLNVTQDLTIYYGNVGAHTLRLGDLKTMGTDELLEKISMFPANYDYNAFYADHVFETLSERLKHLPERSTDRVYSSKADCIYSWLDELGVPNLLI